MNGNLYNRDGVSCLHSNDVTYCADGVDVGFLNKVTNLRIWGRCYLLQEVGLHSNITVHYSGCSLQEDVIGVLDSHS